MLESGAIQRRRSPRFDQGAPGSTIPLLPRLALDKLVAPMLTKAIWFSGLALLAACGGAPPRPEPVEPPATRACEEAYEDLTRYFAADPERRRPPGLREAPFLDTCRELPSAAQRCLLFSYMQSHAGPCDQALSSAPQDVMHRIAVMTGK